MSVDSALPNVLVVTNEWDQAGYVQLAYEAEPWSSNDTANGKVFP